jgi:hypothetical protein
MRRIVFTLFLCAPAVLAQESLTNDDIVSLWKAGLPPRTIVHVINSSRGSYVLTSADHRNLARMGFPDEIITAMESGSQQRIPMGKRCDPAATDTIDQNPLVTQDGQGAGLCSWIRLQPENLSWSGKTRKVFTLTSTAGTKGHHAVGTVKGSKFAAVRASTAPDFVFGGRNNAKWRVVSLKGGARARTLSDASNKVQDCHVVEQSTERQRIHCEPLQPGEYGIYFLAAGGKTAQAIYTFHIEE